MLLIVLAAAFLVLRFFAKPTQGGGVDQPSDNPAPPSTVASSYGNPALDGFVEGWARIEGFYKQGSLAQRNNNPVNLKGNWPGVVGHTDSGFAIFDTPDSGKAAAQSYVQQQATQHPAWSIQNFFGKVLGDLDGNPVNNDQGDSDAEANYVASYSGIAATTALSSYLGM